MDNWMRYQLTGDERYIQAFRRQKALKAALMGGSLGAIGCVSASIMASQVMAKDWPPPTLPKRCGAFLLGFGAISGIYSCRLDPREGVAVPFLTIFLNGGLRAMAQAEEDDEVLFDAGAPRHQSKSSRFGFNSVCDGNGDAPRAALSDIDVEAALMTTQGANSRKPSKLSRVSRASKGFQGVRSAILKVAEANKAPNLSVSEVDLEAVGPDINGKISILTRKTLGLTVGSFLSGFMMGILMGTGYGFYLGYLGLDSYVFALVLGALGPRLARTFVGTAGAARSPSGARRSVEVATEESVVAGDRLKLKLLSPEGDGITVACSEVILPSATGQLGILANHAPMMSALDTGVLRYKEERKSYARNIKEQDPSISIASFQDGQWKPVVVLGGFATVDSNQLSVLVNDFEKAESIETTEAQSEMDAASSMLEKAESKKDKLEATNRLKKAAARLQAAMFVGVAGEGLIIEYSQLEAWECRGQLKAELTMVGTAGGLLATLFIGCFMNSKAYLGTFDWGLQFNQIMYIALALVLIQIPLTMFLVWEPPLKQRPSFRQHLWSSWDLVTVATTAGPLVRSQWAEVKVPVYLTVFNVVRNQYFFLGEEILSALPMAAIKLVSALLLIEMAEPGKEGLCTGLLGTIYNASTPFGTAISNQIFALFQPNLYDVANYVADTPAFRETVAWSYAVTYATTLAGFVLIRLIPSQKEEAQHRKKEWGSHPFYGIMVLVLPTICFLYAITVLVMANIPELACLKAIGGPGCE
eukprot:g9036.t1